MIKFTIPLAPVTKKNHQQILINRSTGKPFVMPSREYKQYEHNALFFIPVKPQNCVLERVNVKATFYMPNRRKCDLTNLLQALDDIMVKSGFIDDDNYTIIAGHDGSRVYVDIENPRTEVEIERIEDEQ